MKTGEVKPCTRIYVEFWRYPDGSEAIAIKRFNKYRYYTQYDPYNSRLTQNSRTRFQQLLQYKKPEFVRFIRGAICIRWACEGY